MIHVYTGEGEGKTIAALGLALRAVGHGKKAVFVQFLKGRKDVGEYLVKDRLAPEFEIHQFGREDFIDLEKPEEIDFSLARDGLSFARKALAKKPDLLVLDEVNLAVAIGLIPLRDLLGLLDAAPPEVTVVLTGRRAPNELLERAELATQMVYLKHPYDKGVGGREGLDY